MPRRDTKRGAERTPIDQEVDVLICGASFAGLSVARELVGSGARVLIVDRYEIGERQTSACGIPTGWLEAMGLEGAAQQEFDELVVHTPHGTSRYPLPFTFSTFDYRTLCELLYEQSKTPFETAKINGRATSSNNSRATSSASPAGVRGSAEGTIAVETDRGVISARFVVDALGWRRVLAKDGYQPPDAPLSRGLEVHPHGQSDDLEIWIDRRYVPAGYGWSFPAGGEQRIGVGSFDPRFHVRETTELLADDLDRDRVRWQGNWIPHKIRPATEDGIFFVGDSAGHCLPLTAEGIRTAMYFGIACGRELREVIEGHKTRERALVDYAAFSDSHEWKFRWMLRVQKLVPKLPARLQRLVIRACGHERFVRWSFAHYLNIAPPDFVGGATDSGRATSSASPAGVRGSAEGPATTPTGRAKTPA